MTLTIDKAGRIVVPKRVRDSHHLYPGAEIELEICDDELRLRPVREEPSLIEKNGLKIHHGRGVTDLDLVAFLEARRAERIDESTMRP